jgi:ATP-binding cassette subfamily F protein 3
VLGAFLFSGDDVKKTVGMLSGGEKARLLLAKLAMEHDNFLILDEPTNHLDIESREVLEQSLIDFDGTLLFVSHDRYFINKVATQILELSPTGVALYLGDYDYYLSKKAEEVTRVGSNSDADLVAVVTESKEQRQEQKESAREERKKARELEAIDQRLSELSTKMNDLQMLMLAQADDYTELLSSQQKLEELQKQQIELEERWLILSEDN